MDFDFLTEREACGTAVTYGVLRGGENIIFVKAGRGGNYRGYKDKYVRFAEYLRDNFGTSVICASNPDECRSSFEADASVILEYARGFDAPKLYLWGTSDGGFKCIDLAEKLEFERLLIVNMPLMINFYKTKEKLRTFEAARIAFFYGDRDPSFKYTPFLYSLHGAKLVELENTGHNVDMSENEMKMFAKYLFS